MRHHTATHLLIGASRRVLGDHAWQSGAQKSVESSRLDISHWKKLTRQETDELERLANKVVMEARKVSTTWVQRDKAEAQYGFRLYQGGAAPGKQIRIVEIEGWDVEACGGTHCRSTSEVGFIKILRTERVQDGVERIIFAAGPAGLEEVQRREKTLFEVAETLGTPLEKVVESLSKVLADRNNLRHEIDSRGKLSAEKTGKELLMKAEDIGGVKVIVYSDSTNVDFLIELANYIAQSDPSSVSVFFNERDGRVVAMVGEEAVTKIHAGALADTASKFLGGRGGGSPSFGQGGGKESQKIPEAVEHMRGHIKRLLS
jgi:alanyl-tRNA synthetase